MLSALPCAAYRHFFFCFLALLFHFYLGHENLYEYRVPLSVVAVICFAISGIALFYKPKSCNLSYKKKKWILIYILFGVILLLLLTYPELLGEILCVKF
ncbi:aryl sulfotransferase [Campylobacter concisus]